MAGINLESMVLNSQAVAGRVVAGVVRMGSVKVDGQAPAYLSYARHLTSHLHVDRQPRNNPVIIDDTVNTAVRAGRPAGEAGVLACAALPERRETVGEPSLAMTRPAMLMPPFAEPFSQTPARSWRRSTTLWAKRQNLAKRGWRKPAAGARAVSTRGQKPGRSALPTSRTSSATFDRGHASR